jgi:hypothetical protein
VDIYLSQIAERRLSPRQAMLLQRLVVVSNSLERVGDHIETIGTLSRIKIHRKLWFDDESMMNLLELSRVVSEMITSTMESIDPTETGYRDKAEEVLRLRKEYKKRSKALKDRMEALVESQGSGAMTAMFFLRYVVNFDRLAYHLRSVARQELKQVYVIKEWKLNKAEPLAAPEDLQPTGFSGHPTVDVAITDLIRRVEQERKARGASGEAARKPQGQPPMDPMLDSIEQIPQFRDGGNNHNSSDEQHVAEFRKR